MRSARATLIWAALATAICVPIAAAGTSPLLQWRDPVYILGGFAGIIALGLLLVQPLLAGGYLPGPSAYRARRVHHWIGGAVVVAVVIHVVGLWVTSPPDMVDALLFASPTPFSPFGVIAMWAIFAAALVAALRERSGLRPRTWRIAHVSLAAIVAEGLTNVQVAERLFVSRHTVDFHLRQIFRKLAVRSRTELARSLVEHDSAPTPGR